jgi:enamine deaminase RidA (YjgF/YER057c/UK114 family)
MAFIDNDTLFGRHLQLLPMTGTIEYINPEGLVKPRGYSHAVAVKGNTTTIYLGGQNAIDRNGAVIGRGDLKAQTEQALTNIMTVLAAAGAGPASVVKFTIYLVQGQDPREGFTAFQKMWGDNPCFPAVTVLFVAGLGHPDWLVEIDAVAVITG